MKNPRLRRAAGAVVEQLEHRRMLSVAPHVAGSLDGKVVYTQGGHGYVWRSAGYWGNMRPYLNTMVEDMGNQDQIQPFADNLLHAGATVVSMRPVGHQLSEIILDNTDAFGAGTGGYQVVSGSWTGSAQTPYWKGSVSGYNSGTATEIANHYAFATTATTETAVARFTPKIVNAGFYPVYTWYRNGSDRPRDATFRVNYSGGSAEVKIAQDLVGKGWIYLGTYYFDAGVNPASGSVDVSNQSAVAGKAVIADAVRFGNGMGDWTEFGAHPISGQSREDESALYWCYGMLGWGTADTRLPTSLVISGTSSTEDENRNFLASDQYATYMNDSAVGTMNDRLWISFHSNAGGGRGTVGLTNTPGTPNQGYLANLAGATVQNEMTALNGPHEFDWGINTPPTFAGSYSEISNNVIHGEFDATIIEVAFHDNSMDSQLLKDPQVRWDVGRAATHTAIQYFDNFDGKANNVVTFLPEPPTNVRAITDASGNVTLQWAAGASSAGTTGPYGNAPTGYRVWKSTNGYGFDLVATPGNVSSYQMSGLPLGAMTYFMVTAINDGGESLQSYTVAAKPQAGRRAGILIVNNFKRLDDDGDLGETNHPIGSPVYRARMRYNNSFDYVIQAGEAIENYNPNLGVESCTDDAIASGAISLSNYHTVIWMSGEQSTVNETFTSTTQPLVASYLSSGGNLFLSGAEIAWDLFGQTSETAADRSFLQNTLHANYQADDANTYATAAGNAGSALAGVGALNLDDGLYGTYNVNTPDVISAGSGATVAMSYSTGAANGAVIQYASGNTKILYAGFPFESIYDPSQRNALMGAVLGYFGTNITATDTTPPTATLGAGSPTPGSANFNFTVTYADGGSGVDTLTFDGNDVTVTGPNSFTATAAFISKVGNVVTYRINAPGGTWDPGDNGLYTVSQNASQVRDLAVNYRPAGTIGSVNIAVPFAYVSSGVLYAYYLAAGNTISLTLNGTNVDAVQSPTTISFATGSFSSIVVYGTGGTDTLDFTGPISQPLTFNGGLGGDKVNVHAGTFTFASDAAATTLNLDLAVANGAAAIFNATQHLDDVTLNGNATLSSGGAKILVTHSLLLGPSGHLNLSDNDLVIDYATTSPLGSLAGNTYDGITGNIAAGQIASSAITSTFNALGVAEASQIGSVFSNETVDATAVLVKFTYGGDANLDGKLNIDDYVKIDQGIAAQLGGWFNGDFNLDGKINIDDYVIIDGNIPNASPTL